MKNSNRIKDGNGRLGLEEAEMRRIWKENYEDQFNIDTQEQVAVTLCSFDGVRRDNYFGEKPIKITEVEVRVGKLRMEMLQLRMRLQER